MSDTKQGIKEDAIDALVDSLRKTLTDDTAICVTYEEMRETETHRLCAIRLVLCDDDGHGQLVKRVA